MESLDKTFEPVEAEVVLFHKGCPDGFASAWIAHLRLKDKSVFYHAVAHGDEPPWDQIKGRNVVVLDFSWPRDIVLQIKELANGFVLLDHHKSADIALRDIAGCTINLTECGATLAWAYFSMSGQSAMRDIPMPPVVRYVRDRDLWLWKMPNSRAFNAGLYMDVPFDFDEWDALFVFETKHLIAGNGEPDTYTALIENGVCYNKMRAALIDPLAKWALERVWKGLPCRVAQVSPRGLRSELGESILHQHPETRVALCWTYDAWTKKHQVSVRTREGETDATNIAEAFGGGGHPAAAAFSVDLGGHSIEALFEE